MPTPSIITVLDQIAWSYANLARAHAALSAGRTAYSQIDHIVRARLFGGLRSGKMAVGSLYDDERIKLLSDRACVYCGHIGAMTMDHLIPRIRNGADDGANLVLACRPCNSSKCDTDLLLCYNKRDAFPSLLLLRRYLKLVASHCEREDVLGLKIDAPQLDRLPFSVDRLPLRYPPLGELRL